MTRVLVPSGALGLGFEADALARGVAARPDVIAIDGGSTDSGPHYLGTGTSKYARATVRTEWRALMEARAEANVPLMLGTAGTCGADSCVDMMVEMTTEIAAEIGQRVRVATLRSSQPAARVVAALEAGRIRPLPPERPLDAALVNSCTNIVALAGAEQVQAALETGADIVIAGRTTDTAIIAALPLARYDHAGAAWHGAKIGECGAFCTTDPRSGTILVDFDAEGFTVTPMGASARCTPHTVSAHMLYENADPFVLQEPGGRLDVTEARYEQAGESVRVAGSRWVPGDYTVKLEGARVAGYQTISLTLVRDPSYVARIEEWIDGLRAALLARVALATDETVEFRLVGRDAALGALEPTRQGPPTAPEIGVLAIVTAPEQARATEIARMANPLLLHHPLAPDEPTPTFAFPFSPAEIERGAAYEFCLNHVMALDDPMAAFRLDVAEIG